MPYRGKRNGGRPSQDGPKSGRNGGKKAPATKRKKYSAPTANHHDILFTSGTIKDAAEFTDTFRVLARHVSTASGYKQGLTLAKAMTDLEAPVYTEPARPGRKYYLKSDLTVIVTNRMSAGSLNKPVQDDLNWSIVSGQLL